MTGTVAQGHASAWIPTTRFLPPVADQSLVLDEATTDDLTKALQHSRLVTVVGPGGSGKSTLLAAAAARLPTTHRLAWIRLDPTDDDARACADLLVVGTTHALAVEASLARQVVDQAQPLQPRRLLGMLINEIAQLDHPLTLVLDDLHHLSDEVVSREIDFLVTHAPADLHIAVSSRRRPPLAIPRLRAKGQLAEFGEHALRLDAERAKSLLNDRLGQGLSDADIEAAVADSAGWVAALVLRGDRQTGQPAAGDDIDHYLAEEVLAQESPEVQEFLLTTSVLDTLTPEACATVSGRPDAGHLLAELRQRLGLFMVDHGEVLRYHDLLREHLSARLAADPRLRLGAHRAAARLSEGPAVVEHLLDGGDQHAAAAALTAGRRQWLARDALAARVIGWGHRLDPEVVRAHPWVGLMVGAARTIVGDLRGAVELLEPLLADDSDFEFHWLVVRYLHFATHDHARFVPQIRGLMADARYDDLPASYRAGAHIGLAWSAFWRGQSGEAAAQARTATAIAREAHDLPAVQGLMGHYIPMLTTWPDGVTDAIDYHEWALQVFGEQSAIVRGGLTLLRNANRVLAGQPWEEPGPECAAAPQADTFLTFGRMAEARAAGDDAGVLLLFQRHLADIDMGGSMQVNSTIVMLGTPLGAASARGDRGAVDELAQFFARSREAMVSLAAIKGVEAQLASSRAVMDGDLELAADRLREALAALGDVQIALGPDPRVELAVLLHQLGHRRDAQAVLTPALRDASSSGAFGRLALSGHPAIGVLSDVRGPHAGTAKTVIARLEGAVAGPAARQVPDSGETLTGREVEVLMELATGATNAQVADRLVISQNTVKTHVKHVLRKLDAATRSEAVARARALRLI